MAKHTRPGPPRQPLPCRAAELRHALATQTLRHVADRFGISLSSAHLWRQRLGVKGPRTYRSWGKVLWPLVRDFLGQHPSGATGVALAHELDCSRQAIYMALCQFEAEGLVYALRFGGRRVAWVLLNDVAQEKEL